MYVFPNIFLESNSHYLWNDWNTYLLASNRIKFVQFIQFWNSLPNPLESCNGIKQLNSYSEHQISLLELYDLIQMIWVAVTWVKLNVNSLKSCITFIARGGHTVYIYEVDGLTVHRKSAQQCGEDCTKITLKFTRVDSAKFHQCLSKL